MKSERFALKVRTAMAEAGSLSGQTGIFLLRNCLKTHKLIVFVIEDDQHYSLA
ncbi:MAG TPA: hypothetical protein VF648_06520 [Pyrinomonadaceae bacterium]|jgi:hypothetical protein